MARADGVIAAELDRARALGIDAVGPRSSDTVFLAAKRGGKRSAVEIGRRRHAGELVERRREGDHAQDVDWQLNPPVDAGSYTIKAGVTGFKTFERRGTDAGVRIKSRRGRGGVVENIHYRNLSYKNIVKEAITIDMFYDVGNNPNVVTAKNALLKAEGEKAALVAKGYGPEWPALKTADSEVAAARRQLVAARASVIDLGIVRRRKVDVAADLPAPLPPPLHPGTREPIGPEMLAPLSSSTRYIPGCTSPMLCTR